ncbi:Mus7/MMS22-like protein [Elsinoe fawcettii]|nr:Mus7/MMS22-like protein [Elsinoe fawcettii]
MPDWKDLGYVPDSDDEDTPLGTATSYGDDIFELPLPRDDGLRNDIYDAHIEDEAQKENRPGQGEVSTEQRHPTGIVASVTQLSRTSTLEGADHARDGSTLLDTFMQDLQSASETPTNGFEVERSSNHDCSSSFPPIGNEADDPQEVQINSAASSPLSDIRSVDGLGQIPPLDLANIAGAAGSLHDRPTVTYDESMAAPSRAFRARKAIQLHPYLLESEKYKQTMRAGGYKPVQLAASQELGSIQPIRRPQVQHSESSSQPTASQDSYRSSSPPIPEIIGILPRSTESSRDPPQPGRLPKRRKLFHIPVITPAGHANRPQDDDELAQDSSPPTPPTSHSGESTIARRYVVKQSGFRLPQTSASATTNAASSPTITPPIAPATTPTPILVNDENHEANRALNSSDDANSEAESSSSDDEVQFASARKRIRGVLPASWLRIDNKAGNPKTDKRRQGLESRTDSAIHNAIKGVAQRKFVTASSPEKPSTRFADFSSSPEDGQPVQTPVRRQGMQSHVAPSTVDLAYDSDQMEDNAVDAMLPGESRNRRKSDNSKKRQSRLDKGLTKPARATNRHKASTTLVDRQSSRKSTRSRQRQPPLSIIDLDASSPGHNPSPPSFVKLARRQARKRNDYGRHSPSHKTIRLATRADTEDALSTLTAWETGHIHPRSVAEQAGPERRPTTARTASVDRPKASRRAGHVHPTAVHLERLMPIERIEKTRTILIKPTEAPFAAHQPSPLKQASSERTSRNASANRSRGMLQATARFRNRFRAAQVETEASDRSTFHAQQPPGLHAYDLTNLSRHQSARAVGFSLQLERFLHDEQGSTDAKQHARPTDTGPPTNATFPLTDTTGKGPSRSFQITRARVRKPAPSRLPVEVIEFRQPALPPPVSAPDDTAPTSATLSYGSLQGLAIHLGPFAIDFDVRHMSLGTYFHSSTFLGSGDFAKALSIADRDLTQPAGHITIRVDNINTQWSRWSDETEASLRAVKDECIEAMEIMVSMSPNDDQDTLLGPSRTLIYLLRSLVRYVANCLECPDTTCKDSFCNAMMHFIEDMTDSLMMKEPRAELPSTQDHFAKCLIYLLTLNTQVLLIRRRSAINNAFTLTTSNMMRQLAFIGFRTMFKTGCAQVHTYLQTLQHHDVRDAGIKDDQTAITFVVVLRHVMRVAQLATLSFDCLMADTWKDRIQDTVDIKRLDSIWYDVLSLQPLHELDALGIYRKPGDSETKQPCWAITKTLMDQTMSAFTTTNGPDQRIANEYLKAVFRRVRLLITKWKWSGSDVGLAVMYDFFARRQLANLPGERASGSPFFLRHLDQDQTLDIESADLGFHAFLKILAVSLRASKNLASSKLRRVFWRFVPNHGRTYRKDQAVHQIDLDALRNHHDILTTLIWALPVGSRPRLELLKELVDFNTSHLEACRINIDAWRNLAVFIMADTTQHEEIPELGAWFSQFSRVLVTQYRLARSEAEELFEMSRDQQSGALSYDVMQMTVTSNQRRILGTVQDSIHSMKAALGASTVKAQQLHLFQEADLPGLLKVFDASQSRTFETVEQVLALLKTVLPAANTSYVNGQSEDSQDYGDSAGFDDLLDGQVHNTNAQLAEISLIQTCVTQLLSNCFGAEEPVSDSLLLSVTDAWCKLAAHSVSQGQRSWTDYLDPHGAQSWFQLRDTERLHQYTPFMLASVLTLDSTCFVDYSTFILSHWVSSLVVPEHQLRYEHTLTTALLNTQGNQEVLFNLPFARKLTGEYDIAISDLRGRRASILATVLSNIRVSLSVASASLLPDLKRSHTAILRYLMSAMKDSYIAITAGSTLPSNKAAIGEQHTIFLQQLVSLLQQHSSEILTIDPFFTNPATFPLPTGDPKYLVAKLKGFVPKLGTEKARKPIIVFLQTVFSKAVLQGDGDAIAVQLEQALLPSPDELRIEEQEMRQGTSIRTTSLRRTMVEDILPAYLGVAKRKPEATFFVLPILEGLGKVIGRMDEIVDLSRIEIAMREGRLLHSFLQSTLRTIVAFHHSTDGPSSVRALLVGAALDVAKGMVSVVDYMHRATGEGKDLLNMLKQILAQARTFGGPAATEPEADVATWTGDDVRLSEMAEFARNNLADEISKAWTWNGGKLFHGRGVVKDEVYVPRLGTQDHETMMMRTAARRLVEEAQGVFGDDTVVELHETRPEHGTEHSEGVDKGIAGLSELCI